MGTSKSYEPAPDSNAYRTMRAVFSAQRGEEWITRDQLRTEQRDGVDHEAGLAELIENGWIEQDGDQLRPTPRGWGFAGRP